MKLNDKADLTQIINTKNFFQFSFLIVINKIRSYEKRELKRHNIKITPKELNYLAIIGKMGKEKQQKLLDFFDVSKGTMSNMIKLLIKKKWVMQERDPKDKRIKHLNLTVEGTKILKVNDQIREDIKGFLEKKLSPNEYEQFIKLTLKLA